MPRHLSPFENSGALILPPLGDFNEYRVVAMGVLCALSILVRYSRALGGVWRVETSTSIWRLSKLQLACSSAYFHRNFSRRSLESASSRLNLGVFGELTLVAQSTCDTYPRGGATPDKICYQ